MTKTILTIDGRGVLREVESSRSGTLYRVAGKGFNGWYSANQILSELSEDETTTNIPFTSDTDGNGNSTLVPEKDPNAADGVKLPWNPEPTDEWDDGALSQMPDGADISLTPSKSTKGIDLSEDPESSTQVFGSINWNENQNQGYTRSGHRVAVNFTPTSISWDFYDKNNNAVLSNAHESYSIRAGLTNEDVDHAYDLIEDDAAEINHKHASMQRAAFRQYENLLNNDEMIRTAAWKQVRDKANRLFRDGKVHVKKRDDREIFASVEGDTATYDTQVHRKNAFGQGVTWWDCDCAWGKNAYLRKRSFVGRMCSHAFATYTAMQSRSVPEDKSVNKVRPGLERHTLGAATWNRGSGEDPQEYGFNPGENYGSGSPVGHANDDPYAAHNDGPFDTSDPAEQFVRGPKVKAQRESLAMRQGGLMVWDDDLAKVMKQIYNQQPPASADPGAAPVDPNAAAGVPNGIGSDLGAPGASPMSADPAGGAGGFGDPTQGDPNGSGLLPDASTPSYVRNNTGVTASNYPTKKAVRHWAEFTDGDTDDLFEEWDDPNSQDADTFNTVQELTEDNDPEEAFYDDFYGRSSSLNLPVVPRIAGRTFLPDPSNDVHNNPFVPAERAEFHAERPTQHYIPEALRSAPVVPRNVQGSLDYLLASEDDDENHSEPSDNDAESNNSWQKNPDVAQQYKPEVSAVDLDHDEESDSDEFKTSSLHDLERWASEESDSYLNQKEAAAFNDDSDEIVKNFQRSAAAMQYYSGRNFSYAEQQDLIDESPDSMASQFGDLNLDNSFYQ